MESSSSPGSNRIALVERGLRLWNSRDFDDALADLDPEIVWETSGVVPGLERVYHGHEGVMRFWRAWTEAWDEIQVSTEEVRERGDDVFVFARFKARGRDGVEVDQPVAFRFTSSDNQLVTRFQAYWDRDDLPLDARTSETETESS